MGIKHESLKLSELYDAIDQKKVVLPNFQRGFVWSIDEQKKLIASILVQIPIGSTLHLKGSKESFSARALCEREEVTPSVQECEYVLDGQQRLSTLKNTFYDIYSGDNSWDKVWDKLFSNLRVRWFLLIDPTNDFFGFANLQFNTNMILESEPREILDYIIPKKILKTKDKDKWFHPAYIAKDDSGEIIKGENQKKLHIATSATKEHLIPLHEVYRGNDGIHSKVIELLTNEQVEKLIAQAKDIFQEKGRENYNSFLIEKLSIVEREIDSMVEEIIEESVENLFKALGEKWIKDFNSFIEKLISIEMPIILLEQKEAGRAAAIFEEINKGGTPLSIYDLIVAKAANADTSKSSLTDRIIKLLNEEYEIPFMSNKWKPACMTDIKDNMLTTKFQSIYLNSLSILLAKKKHETIDKKTISRNYVLNLSADEINENNEYVINTIINTYAFLQEKLGVINEKNIIYDYMILPIIYILSEDEVIKDEKKIKIIEGWYWSSLFSGKYKERQDDQFVKDIDFLSKTILENAAINSNDFLNDRIFNVQDYSDKDTLLHKNQATDLTAPKAIKDAILQYVLSREPYDFLPDKQEKLSAYLSACNDEKNKDKNCRKYKLEIHHIIPLGVVTKIGQRTEEIRNDKTHILNSPLNLTYISECANAAISDMDYNTICCQNIKI